LPNNPSGNSDAGNIGPPPDPESYIRNVSELGEGNAILAASTMLQKAADSKSAKHGVFTKAILDTLADGGYRMNEDVMTVDDLKNNITNRVGSRRDSRSFVSPRSHG
jgi:hypothetical protein